MPKSGLDTPVLECQLILTCPAHVTLLVLSPCDSPRDNIASIKIPITTVGTDEFHKRFLKFSPGYYMQSAAFLLDDRVPALVSDWRNMCKTEAFNATNTVETQYDVFNH